jgi:hypothetical protein
VGGLYDSTKPPRTVRDVAVARTKKAAENLRERQRLSETAKSAGLSNIAASAAPGPEAAANPRGFAGAFFDRVDAAAAPQPEGGPAMSEELAPTEPRDPYQDVSTGAMGYGGALGLAKDVGDSWSTVTTKRRNAMHDPTVRMAGETMENTVARADAQEDAFRTEAAMARDAAALADEAHQIQAQTAARQQFMAAQEARRRDEIDQDLSGYRQAIDTASAEFQKVDKYDPGKAWADKSAGQKIRISLAAIGAGLRGGDPQQVFNDVMQRELAAHRQMRSDAGAALDESRKDMSNALTERDTYLAMAKDERLAEAMLEASTAKKIQAKVDAKMAEYGPQQVNDRMREAQAVAAQMVTDTQYRMEQLVQSQPKYFVSQRRVSSMTPEERQIRMKMAGQMVDTAGEAQKQGLTAQTARAKSAATDEYGLTERDWRQIEKYGGDTETGKLEGIIRQIDTITAPEDIKGVDSVTKKWIGEDPRNLNQKMRLLEEAIGRAQSGGAITEEEGERFRDMLEAGVAWGGGESRLRSNLAEVRSMMNSRLETKRRSLSPAAQRYITRGEATEYTSERHSAGYGRKRVQAADGSITTNRSEFE